MIMVGAASNENEAVFAERLRDLFFNEGEEGENFFVISSDFGVLLLRMFFALFCTIWRVRLK